MLGTDSVVNTFSLNLRNKSPHRRELGVEFAGSPGAAFSGRHDWEGRRYAIGSGQRRTLPFHVIAHRDEFSGGRREVNLLLRDGAETWTFKVLLAGPMGSASAR